MEKLDLLDKFICSVVGCMALLAAVFGFVAEAKRDPGHGLVIDGTCTSVKSGATSWALVSALLLLVVQFIVNGAVRCVCCRGSYLSSWKKTIAIICFVVSWISFLVAIGLFMQGVIKSLQRQTTTNIHDGKCWFSKTVAVNSGTFVGGSFLALTSISLGIIYYILTSEGRKMEKPTRNQNNFAMT